MRPALLASALILGLAASPAPALQLPSDSVDIHEDARAAQARFERVRMAHLPWGRSRAGSPRDEIVGRLVLLPDDDEEWRPPPDPPPVREARGDLLASLERAASELRGDEWIAGQLVFYHVEAGRLADALASALTCRGQRWWCRALVGYAHHSAGSFVAAETAFEEALAAMPAEERADWLEIDDILDRDARSAYREAAGADRAVFLRRFWWLADPLWSMPGNDRRTEHFSRQVLDRILRDARTPFQMGWGDDLREVLIRYGWPAGWERIRSRTWSLGAGGGTGIVGHDPPGEKRFVPTGEAVRGPTEHGLSPGDLDDDGARSTYAPSYAERFFALEHQLAVFRRGDSVRVVAGWSLGDSLAAGRPVEAALVVAPDPDHAPRITRRKDARRSGSIALTAPWSPAVVSLEVVAPEAGLAARARYGLPLAGRAGDRPAVSDLLLIDPVDPLPSSLEEVVPRARGTTRVDPGEPLGLFWEFYPPGGGPYDVQLSVRLRDERGGFLRGLGAVLGLTGRRSDTVALEWSESLAARAERHPRALVLELPELPAGTYALELEAVLPDSRRARTERSIVVE